MMEIRRRGEKERSERSPRHHEETGTAAKLAGLWVSCTMLCVIESSRDEGIIEKELIEIREEANCRARKRNSTRPACERIVFVSECL